MEMSKLATGIESFQSSIRADMKSILRKESQNRMQDIAEGRVRTSILYLPFRAVALTSRGFPDMTSSRWTRAFSLSPLHACKRPYSKSVTQRQHHRLVEVTKVSMRTGIVNQKVIQLDLCPMFEYGFKVCCCPARGICLRQRKLLLRINDRVRFL